MAEAKSITRRGRTKKQVEFTEQPTVDEFTDELITAQELQSKLDS